jgi:hypothetical protein
MEGILLGSLALIALFSLFWALAYWVTNKALKPIAEFSFKQKAILAAVIPVSMYLPVFLFEPLKGYFFFLYLITLPAGVYITKLVINNEAFTFKNIRTIYWAVFLRILGTMAILGFIARALKFSLNH